MMPEQKNASIALNQPHEINASAPVPTNIESLSTSAIKTTAQPHIKEQNTPEILVNLNSPQLSAMIFSIEQIMEQYVDQMAALFTEFMAEFAIKLITMTSKEDLKEFPKIVDTYNITKDTPLFVIAIGATQVPDFVDHFSVNSTSGVRRDASQLPKAAARTANVKTTESFDTEVKLFKSILSLILMESATHWQDLTQNVTIKGLKFSNADQFRDIDSFLSDFKMSNDNPAIFITVGRRMKPIMTSVHKDLASMTVTSIADIPDAKKVLDNQNGPPGNDKLESTEDLMSARLRSRVLRHIECDEDLHDHASMTEEEKLAHGCHDHDHGRKRRSVDENEKARFLVEKWNRIAKEIHNLVSDMAKTRSLLVKDVDQVIDEKIQKIPAQVEQENSSLGAQKAQGPVASSVPVTDLLIGEKTGTSEPGVETHRSELQTKNGIEQKKEFAGVVHVVEKKTDGEVVLVSNGAKVVLPKVALVSGKVAERKEVEISAPIPSQVETLTNDTVSPKAAENQEQKEISVPDLKSPSSEAAVENSGIVLTPEPINNALASVKNDSKVEIESSAMVAAENAVGTTSSVNNSVSKPILGFNETISNNSTEDNLEVPTRTDTMELEVTTTSIPVNETTGSPVNETTGTLVDETKVPVITEATGSEVVEIVGSSLVKTSESVVTEMTTSSVNETSVKPQKDSSNESKLVKDPVSTESSSEEDVIEEDIDVVESINHSQYVAPPIQFTISSFDDGPKYGFLQKSYSPNSYIASILGNYKPSGMY